MDNCSAGADAQDIERLEEELRAERSRRETLERTHSSLLAAFERLEGGVVLLDDDQVPIVPSPLLFSTSIISSASTTPTVTRGETSFCGRSRGICSPFSAEATPPCAGEARNFS